ncbi:Bloom syndrome protein homolog, partial [Elysia marginata]
MKDILLRVADEVCDIICNISTGDLMNLVASDYERLQRLLSVRKQIKDWKAIDLAQPLVQVNHSTPISRTSGSATRDVSGNAEFKASSSQSVCRRNSQGSSVKMDKNSVPGPTLFDKNISPFPSLNSFYDAETPKSHISQAGQARTNTSIRAEYYQGDSFSNISGGVFSRRNSFDDLFETQNPNVADIAEKGSCPNFNKSNSVNMRNNDFQDQLLDTSTQSSKEIDDIDYEDEMEVAMMFDEENYNGFQNSRKESAQNSIIHERKSVNENLSFIDTEPTDGFSFQESFQDPGITSSDVQNEDYFAVFGAGDRDDGTSPEFTGMNFEHSDALQSMFRQIPASHLSSDVDNLQAQSIYSGLFQRTPAYKMLYVTPEKLSASEKLLNCLDSLYKRQLLTRFVIDEAHCVSHWGHDFRPDYKKLYVLRQRYPGVPMMALTATATPRVRKDIIHQLGMTSPKWFMQSFNRPNLKYTVQNKKPSCTTSDIIEMIKTKFHNDSGIVYCLSRKECDSVATELQQAGIQAESYHAGLDDSSRARVQERWLSDDNCKVICATIAFGMGIDKSDVRFVIHYSLPKSVEGYYQEAGRAGRDGVLSYCILFYSYQDVKRLRRMLDMDPNATYESKRVHIDNLFRMISYCENVTDCRRCQILQYFGECSFDRSMCAVMPGAVCDNCQTK